MTVDGSGSASGTSGADGYRSEPNFSVVIPTFQRPDQVLDAIESVLGQEHAAAEVIVVSDEHNPSLAAVLASRYEGLGLQYVETAGQGVSVARNWGAQLASSPWVSFLDDDDLWHPRHLAETALLLDSDPEVCAVYGSVWRFSENGHGDAIDLTGRSLNDLIGAADALAAHERRPEWDAPVITGNSYARLLAGQCCLPSSTTIERSLIDMTGGFPVGVRSGQDWAFAVKIARFTEWHRLPHPTVFYRVQQASVTGQAPLSRPSALLGLVSDFWSDETETSPPHPALEHYGSQYRSIAQSALWRPLRRLRMGLALRGIRLGCRLLPRWRDRLYCLAPPPLTRLILRLSRLARA